VAIQEDSDRDGQKHIERINPLAAREREAIAKNEAAAAADIESINRTFGDSALKVPEISENLAWLPCLQPPPREGD
jgi:hypothetical protein